MGSVLPNIGNKSMVILSGLHLPGCSEIVQRHRIVVNQLCGKRRSHVMINIEVRLEKCTKDYSNETIKHSATVFTIHVLSIIDTS